MNRLSEKTNGALNAVAAIWAFALAFVIVADVVGRMFGYPLQGTAEIVANSIVAIVFLQFPLAVERGYFLRATVLHDVMPTTIRALLDVLAYLLGLALFLAIAMGSWQDMLTGFRIGEFEGEGALRVPVYPVRAIIVGMSLLIVAVYALLIARTIAKLFSTRRGTEPKSVNQTGKGA
jgi:TRAP-type C4-dicarboxylate transport system permease small subunit